jgi:hypothetical protein
MTTEQEDTFSAGRGGRMSRQRKREAMLRLRRGEDLKTVSRSLGVTAVTQSDWRAAFLDGGEASLASKGTARRDAPRARAAGAEDCASGGQQRPFGPPEIEAMSRMRSPRSGKPYGLARVCRIWRGARASIYRYRHPAPARQRPGPTGPMLDAALLDRRSSARQRAMAARSALSGRSRRTCSGSSPSTPSRSSGSRCSLSATSTTPAGSSSGSVTDRQLRSGSNSFQPSRSPRSLPTDVSATEGGTVISTADEGFAGLLAGS